MIYCFNFDFTTEKIWSVINLETKLRVLVEDKNFNPALESEHGLSIFADNGYSKFIFDCGHTGLAWKNSAKLNIDLTAINFVAISHSHYDHAGGFPSLLNYVTPKILYTGVDFWEEKFSRADSNFAYKGAGFTAKDLSRWNIEQKICHDILKLDDKTFLVGNFARHTEFETIPEKFVRGENKLPDTFSDEICLVIRGSNGLNVIVGCSHVGIVNIISTIAQRFNEKIVRIIGGVHLLNADDERIHKTLAALKNFGVSDFKLCHCSGEKIGSNISTGDEILI